MDIYLLRHGVSVSNELSLVCGAKDFPLSDKGERQAKKICKHLNDIEFTKIYCSPLKRAMQTIMHLTEFNNSIFEKSLIELDTGGYSDLKVQELYTIDERYKYQGLNPDLKYPDGECLNDMYNRVACWFSDEIKSWSIGDKILISGHEGTVSSILHFISEANLKNYPLYLVDNCQVVHVTVNEDAQFRIKFWDNYV